VANGGCVERRTFVGATVALPVVTVVTAFVVSQSQLARLVGAAPWAPLLWPTLEWLGAAALVAAWYTADWPRWTRAALVRSCAEGVVVVGGTAAFAVLFVPGFAAPTYDATALVPSLTVLVPLALWCAAEETVLRGVLGRVTAALPPVARVSALAGVAMLVAWVTGQYTSGYALVAGVAIEGVSVVGWLTGQPLAVLALRRWILRTGILVCGLPAVGFSSGVLPLVRLPLADPGLAVLLVVTACVIWECIIVLAYLRTTQALQQNPPRSVS
jgi:hypothetical protein